MRYGCAYTLSPWSLGKERPISRREALNWPLYVFTLQLGACPSLPPFILNPPEPRTLKRTRVVILEASLVDLKAVTRDTMSSV